MGDFNQLSTGCQLCQQGKWLCIFITYQCDACCHFCPAPYKDDRIGSAFGNKKEEILPYLVDHNFGGIGFSGGDPFLAFNRLMEWVVYFKKQLPDLYYWVYTNGLHADRKKLEQLSLAGMNEIRFNIAATGYLSDKIWERITIARSLFPYVAVEIPSIHQDHQLLAKAIDRMEEAGIDYLNLHDYIVTETDDKPVNEAAGTFLLNKVVPLKYALSSIGNTKNIIDLVARKGYRVRVNHCSMQQKEIQMVQRRLKMGEIFNDQETDMVLNDGTICNYYNIPDELFSEALQKNMVYPEFRNGLRSYLLKKTDPIAIHPSDGKLLKVISIPQMEVRQEKMLIQVEVVEAKGRKVSRR